MTDNYLILHGCPPSAENVLPSEKKWMNWIADKLVERGFKAEAPEMPTAWDPKYDEWKEVFKRCIVTENSLLVGHSCGAAFLVRWLLENKKRVKKLILVAPAKVPETNDDKRQALYKFELPSDASRIAKEIIIFTSNDFPHHKKALDIYKRVFRTAKIIELKNKQHFLYFQMGTNEFPELLAEILK
jgi:predicted alpha/beta hydrolase family esterase